MPTWGIQLLQAVWYITGQPPAIGDLFQGLVGTPATSTQSTRGIALAMAQEADSVFRLQQQPGRIDFFENPQPQPGARAFPIFPDFPKSLEKFRARLPRADVADVGRIALVITLSQPTATAAEAIELILTKVGFDLPFRDVQDFIFQINRRKPFTSAANIEMHRVLKWTAESFQLLELSSAGAPPTFQLQDVATFAVDLSNVLVTGRAFSRAEQAQMFQEMGDEADRLCNANSLASLA